MTNYGIQDGLSELWKDILSSHWRYLECEESLQKIAERKKLEGCLREYLSVVSHDRKFLLAETGDCLKTSVLQMKNFSPYKAAIGFESISQYANNLFTKPWRKEYRTIKMYSGFYQHEIKANLLNAEKMFIAMGYKLLPNQTMVLEDPICPDQVTNVSRDAMACKVECEIMKYVNSELTAMQLPTSWLEIFQYRERHVGDSSNALKGLAYQIQHRSMRKSQNENYYNAASLVQSSSSSTQLPSHNVPYMCNSQCTMQQHPYQNTSVPVQQTNPYSPTPHPYYQPDQPPHPPPCSVHMNGSLYGHQPSPNQVNFAHNHSMNYQQQQQQQQSPATGTTTMQIPHSKSLDQYDQNQYNHNQYFHQHRHSVDHAITLKNQQQQQQSSYDCVDANSCNFSAFKNHPYNVPNNRFPLPYQISNSNIGMYGNGMICKGGGPPMLPAPQQQQPIPPPLHHQQQQQQQQQQTPDQFYDLDPLNYRPPAPQAYNPYYPPQSVPPMMNDDQYQFYHHHHHHHPNPMQQQQPKSQQTIYSDIIPPPELINFSDNPKPNEVKLKSSLRAPKQDYLMYNNCDGKIKSNSGQTTPTTNTNSDSINVRNQEGIGSYDTWNYVFKNLEKQGYREESPDELENDFNDMHLTNSAKNSSLKSKSVNSGQMSSKSAKQLPQTPNVHAQSDRHTNGNGKHSSSVQSKSSVQKSSTKVNGNGTNNRSETVNGTTKSTKKKSIEQNKVQDQPDAMWNCRFCTFLNPETIRICQMCAKSKDFFLDSDNGTTCV